jgi:tetratricopeptide (TPR) repeat protein
MRRRLLVRVALMAALCCAVGRSFAAEPSASTLAQRSLDLCESGRQAGDAHFALFCNRGEAMRLDGESITDVLAFRALQRELDRTLELAPNHPGALSAKGTFLVRLPRVLGGDVDRGEAMLQQVITIDPTAITARLGLARVCEYRGRREEGIEYARRALQFARELGRADKMAEAQALLAELGASY